MAAQWQHAVNTGTEEDFKKNLGDAWSASHFFADMVNMPMLEFEEDGFVDPDDPDTLKDVLWSIKGVSFDGQDMPGIAGVAKARKEIRAKMDGGMTRKEAMESVNTEFLTDLGALAFRAQKQDLLLHVFGDPLNYVGFALTKARKLRHASEFHYSMELAASAPDIPQAIARVERAVGALDDVKKAGTVGAELGQANG
ncbi:MAG: hypothetical protein JRC86_11860 [Deltaproteobacteria bacterium]|nr:hypothetical protein [Deltaproteobacteria bacterium]